MLFRKIILLLLAIAFTGGCSVLGKREASTFPKEIYHDGNEIRFIARITNESAEELISLYNSLEKKPDTLAVSSPGGYSPPGVRIGHWIADNNLNVRVVGFCHSSCANYLFPAGKKRKLLHKDSQLSWHMGAYGIHEALVEQYPQIIEWRKQETEFYKRIGVDGDLPSSNFREHYSAIKYFYVLVKWNLTGVQSDGVDYSLEDLKKMGITGIELIDGEWDWRKYYDDSEIFRLSYEDLKKFPENRNQSALEE